MRLLAIFAILLVVTSSVNASFNASELAEVVGVCMPKALAFFT
jgi:hypothetical protein